MKGTGYTSVSTMTKELSWDKERTSHVLVSVSILCKLSISILNACQFRINSNFLYVKELHAGQFENNWVKKIHLTAKVDEAAWLPIPDETIQL